VPELKIGELAKRSGVSVRTLHHYDDIGLLAPSHRTPSGHRLYGRDEIARLQQIVSLRQMGFSLEQIAEMLRGDGAQRVIAMHIERLRTQIAMQQELCTRLERIASTTSSVDELLQTIEKLTLFEKYYTREQLDTLSARAALLDPTRLRDVQEEWPRLMRAVREELARGTDPKDPRVLALARQWRALIEEFTGGDTGIEQSLRNLYANESGIAEQHGPDRDLNDYIARALS
jgi:MerR family transcriptional regulator, thiopeptide resistance regulator